MNLKTIFEQLAYGPLSQARIGGEEQGVINEANARQILGHVNLGLTSLYRRFLLKQGKTVVALQPNQTTYVLSSRFAVANIRSREPVRHILDDAFNPFKDDVLKIDEVLANDYPLPLNQSIELYSCSTPTMSTLEVPIEIVNQSSVLPEEFKTDRLTVKYRARHPDLVLPIGMYAPERIQVELPDSHLEALLWYVASLVHNPIGMTNEFHAGNSYMAKYEAACLELENRGLRIDTAQNNQRFRNNGWV